MERARESSRSAKAWQPSLPLRSDPVGRVFCPRTTRAAVLGTNGKEKRNLCYRAGAFLNKRRVSLPRLAFLVARRAVPATTGPELAASGHPTRTPRFCGGPGPGAIQAPVLAASHVRTQRHSPGSAHTAFSLPHPSRCCSFLRLGPRKASPAMGAKNVGVACRAACTAPRSPGVGYPRHRDPTAAAHWRAP